MYINDLAVHLKDLDKGVTFDSSKICSLLYADDLVLLAEKEDDLQFMLDNLY